MTEIPYDDEWAANYERRANAAIPGREGLYRLCRAALLGMPADSRILVVGCGTGAELISLAKMFPTARFVGVEPAKAMLEHCQRQVDAEGLAGRVRLEPVGLEEFDDAEPFDAATSILVSQHVRPDAAAAEFFARIAQLLKPGARLYTADTHTAEGQDRNAMVALWCEQAVMSGIEIDLVARMRDTLIGELMREESTIVGFLRAAGFEQIVKCFSSLIYGVWTARKTKDDRNR